MSAYNSGSDPRDSSAKLDPDFFAPALDSQPSWHMPGAFEPMDVDNYHHQFPESATPVHDELDNITYSIEQQQQQSLDVYIPEPGIGSDPAMPDAFNSGQFEMGHGFAANHGDVMDLAAAGAPTPPPEFLFRPSVAEPDPLGLEFGSNHIAANGESQPVYISPNPDDALSNPEGAADDPYNTFLSTHRQLIVTSELSPVATTASLTPSVSSVHLTQPSFFSAQYIRLLFEQPPSSIQRQLFDHMGRPRLLIDSLGSGAPVVSVAGRNGRSFSSYFSFMGDRKLPSPGEWPPASQQTQLRHLIRGIFKSAEHENEVEGEDGGEDYFDEKKVAKRPRRNLFNRFKSQKSADYEDTLGSTELEHDETLSGNLDTKAFSSTLDSVTLTSSNGHLLGLLTHDANVSFNGNGNGNTNSDNPDYGALFHGVGKRRNIVGMKSKRRPVDLRLGDEERRSEELGLVASIPLSSLSNDSKESREEQAAGGFASASKRILGARLLRKKVKKQEQSEGDEDEEEEEVDVETFELPPGVELRPRDTAKSRTRGRKEDKAKDMVDELKIFVCGYCSRRFKRQEHLRRHFRSLHTQEKPFECPFCAKKFSRTDNLAQHVKVHKQEEEEREEEERAAAAAGEVSAP